MTGVLSSAPFDMALVRQIAKCEAAVIINQVEAEPTVQDRDPNIINSGLSRTVTSKGMTVKVMIYRLEHEPRWALEVANDKGTSTVWETLFDTDDEALQAFQLALKEEGIDAFLDRSNVIEFPRR